MVINVGFLVFDGLQGLDLMGPLETLATVTSGPVRYCTFTLGQSVGSIETETGVKIFCDHSLTDHPPIDVLVVPGGAGTRDEAVIKKLVPFIKTMANQKKTIASVCTGSYLLAKSGILDGRHSTTHWRFADAFQKEFPNIRLTANAIFTQDDNIFTSAGVTAGIDLMLHMIEQDCGRDIAISVAKELVVHFKRDGDQAQFSTPLSIQHLSTPVFSNLYQWLEQNLAANISVTDMAQFCHMSLRNFSRRFRAETGATPASFFERMRLDHGRLCLEKGSMPISQIAQLVGYQSSDSFRRAFERQFSMTPSAYRQYGHHENDDKAL